MFRKILKLTHKILGLLLSILFLMWFLSGIVMIYHSFPRASQQDKLERQQVIDGNLPDMETLLSVLPDSAQVRSLSMEMYFDRPVVHFRGKNTPETLYADSLQPVEAINDETIERTAAQWCSSPILRVDSMYKLDQWIPFGRLREEFPIYKYTFADDGRHELYISSKTGRVLQFTDNDQRLWAWLGAIPHWVYFTSLRQNQVAWINFVKWSSGIGCIMCLAGLILSIQLAWRNRHKKLFSPYRKRWFKWHYVSGLIFGIFTITFAFSGMMSLMDIPDWMKKAPKEKQDMSRRIPWGGSEGRFVASAYHLDYRKVLEAVDSVKSIEWATWQKYPYYRLTTDSQTINIDATDTTAIRVFLLTEDMVRKEAVKMYGDSIPYKLDLLTEYDQDYYGRKKDRTQLPVYRIIVDDEMHTRHYYQPETLMQRRVDDDGRLRRLLYSGLHSLNIKFLTDRPVLWNIVMYTLLLGGTFLSLTGVVLSIKWIIRKANRFFKQKV